jgi:hypothetical protein
MLGSVQVGRVDRKGFAAVIFAVVGLVLILPPGVGASNKPSEAELAAITVRGQMLAEYDSAAWRATDAVMAAHPKTDSSGRYIAHKTEAGWVVDFGHLNSAGDKFLVDYEADPAGSSAGFEVKSFNPEREDAGWNLAAAKGIETATKDFGKTNRPYNVAAFPKTSGGMYVYLYPAQVKEGVYPLGADVRYRISPDGTTIMEKRQIHKSIIESAPAGADVKVASGYHTHVLSDVPEDTDVLLVLTRKPRVPEIVVTASYMYTIGVDGKITVEDRPKQ